MKLLKRLLLSVLVLAVLLVGGLFALVSWIGAPTTGSQISAYATPKTALLVVDIQEDFTGPQAKKPYRDATRIIDASNALISQAVEHGALVVFVQNVVENPVFSVLMGGVNAPGAPGTEMDRRLTKPAGAPTFTKSKGDAFINPKLDEYLRANQVNRLLVVGLDAAYCVTSTTLGARNRGYQVELITDGIATESGKSMATLEDAWRKSGASVKSSMVW